MNPRHRTHRGGFTLIELLIAMVLASLLGLLTYAGLQLGLQGWALSERRIEQNERLYLSQAMLRRLLESPLRRTLRDRSGTQQSGFHGDGRSLIFISELPGITDGGSAFWAQLTHIEPEQTQPPTWQLLLRYLPLDSEQELDWRLLEQQLADSGQQEVLLDDLHEPLRFEYLGRYRDQQLDWHEDWREQPQLPLLIRVAAGDESTDPAIRLSITPREHAYGVKVLD